MFRMISFTVCYFKRKKYIKGQSTCVDVGPPLGPGSSTLFETEFFFLLFTARSARPVDLGASGDSLVSSSHLALGTPGLEICIIAPGFT